MRHLTPTFIQFWLNEWTLDCFFINLGLLYFLRIVKIRISIVLPGTSGWVMSENQNHFASFSEKMDHHEWLFYINFVMNNIRSFYINFGMDNIALFYVNFGMYYIGLLFINSRLDHVTSVGNYNTFINFFLVKTMTIKTNSSGEKTIFKPGSSFSNWPFYSIQLLKFLAMT